LFFKKNYYIKILQKNEGKKKFTKGKKTQKIKKKQPEFADTKKKYERKML